MPFGDILGDKIWWRVTKTSVLVIITKFIGDESPKNAVTCHQNWKFGGLSPYYVVTGVPKLWWRVTQCPILVTCLTKFWRRVCKKMGDGSPKCFVWWRVEKKSGDGCAKISGDLSPKWYIWWRFTQFFGDKWEYFWWQVTKFTFWVTCHQNDCHLYGINLYQKIHQRQLPCRRQGNIYNFF